MSKRVGVISAAQNPKNQAGLGGICNLLGVDAAGIIKTNSCQVSNRSQDSGSCVNRSKPRRKCGSKEQKKGRTLKKLALIIPDAR